jgi:tetratricopeptide (TPR) repeat protein
LPLAGEVAHEVTTGAGDVRTGLLFVIAVTAIPVIVALVFLARYIYRHTLEKKFSTTITEDYRQEAAGHEKAGRFVSAAAVYEKKLKEYRKAAPLYEKGGDFRRAAELYSALGMSGKTKEMYGKAGRAEDAAEVSMVDGEFEEAARIYDKAGKKIDAALALETAGRKLAAARVYREAGEYMKAARLLEEEGMLREAAEMYGFSLRDRKIDSSSIEEFYRYAAKLENAGETEKALSLYREIDRVDPTYRDVREKVQRMGVPGSGKPTLQNGQVTLRSFIKSGEMEPKQSLKLWLQILRQLQGAYEQGRPYGLLSPDNILIDTHNNIIFFDITPSSAYTSPESTRGVHPDERADVYAAGVILYEMLIGTLEGLGTQRVIDVVDVPEWLDELVIQCIKKVREDRYEDIEAIFQAIKTLTKSRGERERKSPGTEEE